MSTLQSPLAGLPPVPTLRQLAFLGDGRRGALLNDDGAFQWLCFPSWSDPAVFCGLLGSGGRYQVVPKGRRTSGGYYEDGTLIWRSRWITEHGAVECREALAYPGEAGRAILLRQVHAVDHAAALTVELALAGDYGRSPIGGWRREGGRWESGRGEVWARWSGAPEARVGTDGSLELELVLSAGETRDLVLELLSGTADAEVSAEADELWARTERNWRQALPACDEVAARADVRRAFAVMRGMTSPSGATVAAATTSLPERAEAGRNYDYRFCWLRDSCYVGHAGAAISGAEPVLDGAVRWVVARLLEHGDATAPAYRHDGGEIPEQADLGLPGYPGGHDVVGNRARSQFQLDLFGEALVLLARAAKLDRLDHDGWKAAEITLGSIGRHWGRPDSGIWEIEPAMWTHSRLICVAGLRAFDAIAPQGPLAREAGALADAIERATDRTSRHPSGRWKRAPDDDRVDASLVLAEIRGALPPSDPRSEATRRAVARELSKEGFVFRYDHPGSELGDKEGAFLICNFWMALAHSRAGHAVEAARWFERGRAAAGSPGLFAEEYDVTEHQLRGNIPQVFVHALLAEAAAEQKIDEDQPR